MIKDLSDFIVALIFVFQFTNCTPKTNNYYPPLRDDISEDVYNKRILLIDSAYIEKDYFEVGIQLSNLKGDKNEIFGALGKGVKKDFQNCSRVYQWHENYLANFRNNVVKADSLRFVELFNLCTQTYGIETYNDFVQTLEENNIKRLARREPIDTTRFDFLLIEKLDTILKDDQDLRKELNSKLWNSKEEKVIWTQIKTKDSLNISRVIKILKNGYPSVEKIG
ncbi:MAG: hypothetical protein ACI9FN_001066 [Saprospiraceae bacterium]|jgi:hypothetical protein